MPACSFCGVRLTQFDLDEETCPVCTKTLTLRDWLDVEGGDVVVAMASRDAALALNESDRAAGSAGKELSVADFCTVDFSADAPPMETAARAAADAPFDPRETIDLSSGIIASAAGAAPEDSLEEVLPDPDDILNSATVDLDELNLHAAEEEEVNDESGNREASDAVAPALADSGAGESGGLRPHLTKPKARSAARAKKG